MKKAFLSLSFKHKSELKSITESVVNIFSGLNIDVIVFAQEFCFSKGEEEKMMNTALEYIKNSDIFIAEVSYKEIGIGIEAGYAKALNKQIVYLKSNDSELSTTLLGIASIMIEYKNVEELENKLLEAKNKLLTY